MKAKHKNTLIIIGVAIGTAAVIYLVAKKVMAAPAPKISVGGTPAVPGTKSTPGVGSSPSKVLQQQSNPVYDSDVAVLQQYLNDYSALALQQGWPMLSTELTVDGKFGPLTEAALKFYLNQTSITVDQLATAQANLALATTY